MPPAENEPVEDQALSALFAPFEGASRIALAVSGGVDSLALLLLIDRWRRSGSKPEAIVLTVDHRLRPRSGAEAKEVVRIARGLGMKARTLTWDGPRPASDIEAAARAARYRLLIEAARKAGASHLLLAHHSDDLAETFLMRLVRGAGVFGLAAMRPAIRTAGITIARPLLDLPRSRLAASVAAAGLLPVEDPMNDDTRYLRARVRRLLPLLQGEGIDAARLAATARRLADSADALDEWAGRLIARAATFDDLATVRLDPALFFAAPTEVRSQALGRLLVAIGGDPYPPRYERLAGMLAAMDAHWGGRFKRTLGGVVVEWREGFVLFRESGREGLPSLAVKSGFSGTWDHRFTIEIGAGAPAGLTLGPLGEDGRRGLGELARAAPPGALAALPALRRRGAILAVPSLLYWATGVRQFPVSVRSIVKARLAEPLRFPDFSEQ